MTPGHIDYFVLLDYFLVVTTGAPRPNVHNTKYGIYPHLDILVEI